MISNARTLDAAQIYVQYVLYSEYDIPLADCLKMVRNWFKHNPSESWISLNRALQTGEIAVKDNKFLDLRQLPYQKLMLLASRCRGRRGLEIRDRKHGAKNYPLCFLGSDMVSWLQVNCNASLSEAIRLGQLLIDNCLMHHVLDEHEFKNEALFYRFYADEELLKSEIS